MRRGLTEVLRMECPIAPGSTRVARKPGHGYSITWIPPWARNPETKYLFLGSNAGLRQAVDKTHLILCRDESLVIQKEILFAKECIQLKNWIRQDHTFTNNQRHVVKYSHGQGEWSFYTRWLSES